MNTNMPRPRFSPSSPFEPLHLSLSDKSRLQELTALVVKRHVTEYELQYMQQQQKQDSAIDEKLWKLVKQREGIRVYAERRRDRRHRQRARNSNAALSSSSSWHQQRDDPGVQHGLPVLLVTGTALGTLDDMMFGVVNATLEDMRLKTLYVKDHITDAAVLATLASPTLENPFESSTIKWMENGQRSHLRPLVKNRDFVYMETTGVLSRDDSAHGEGAVRMGYHFLHSVHFPQTRELASRVRGSFSVCGLYIERESRPGVVEVFVKGVVDPAGDIMRSIAVRASASALVSAWRNLDCAYSKKLAWRLRQRIIEEQRPSKRRSSTATTTTMATTQTGSFSSWSFSSSYRSTASSPPPPLSSHQCAICQQSLSSSSITTTSKLTGSSCKAASSGQCELCLQRICSPCTIRKQLSWLFPSSSPSPALQALHTTHSFCAACIRETRDLSARGIMRDEIRAKRQQVVSVRNHHHQVLRFYRRQTA